MFAQQRRTSRQIVTDLIFCTFLSKACQSQKHFWKLQVIPVNCLREIDIRMNSKLWTFLSIAKNLKCLIKYSIKLLQDFNKSEHSKAHQTLLQKINRKWKLMRGVSRWLAFTKAAQCLHWHIAYALKMANFRLFASMRKTLRGHKQEKNRFSNFKFIHETEKKVAYSYEHFSLNCGKYFHRAQAHPHSRQSLTDVHEETVFHLRWFTSTLTCHCLLSIAHTKSRKSIARLSTSWAQWRRGTPSDRRMLNFWIRCWWKLSLELWTERCSWSSGDTMECLQVARKFLNCKKFLILRLSKK